MSPRRVIGDGGPPIQGPDEPAYFCVPDFDPPAPKPAPDTSRVKTVDVRQGDWDARARVDVTPDPGWPEPDEGWVRRASANHGQHRCDPPPGERCGDLWRCRCGRLWRTTEALGWRPATWRQRIWTWLVLCGCTSCRSRT